MKRGLRGIRPIRILPFGFLLIILLGTVLLCLPAASKSGVGLNFFDALFTSTSATCVTGLIVVDTATQFSLFGQAIILLLIQVGGLGFMTMAAGLFMMVRKQVSLYERMTLMQGLGESHLTGLRGIAITAAKITAVCEGAGAVLLSISFIPRFGLWDGIWKSIFHSVSAFCNAGFDILGTFASFEQGYSGDILVNFTLMALIVTGGLGFAVVLNVVKTPKIRKWRLHTRMVVLASAALILIGWALFLILEWGRAYANLPAGEKVLAGLFQSVTLRTAGFSTVSQATLSEPSKFVSIIWMLIGGSPAGTAGGIKTTTVVVLFLAVRAMMKNRAEITVGRRRIGQQLIIRALSLLIFAMVILFAATLAVSLLERGNSELGLVSIVYELASALGTVGLTSGLSGVATAGTKVILIVLMFIGRVGMITVALSFTRQKREAQLRYPVEEVPIG
ncbi:MAG: potassium transporter TrkG [Clostridia bacterium]|nr:potassium transporter TrkG [Clostridia bacterium]